MEIRFAFSQGAVNYVGGGGLPQNGDSAAKAVLKIY